MYILLIWVKFHENQKTVTLSFPTSWVLVSFSKIIYLVEINQLLMLDIKCNIGKM